MLTIVNKGSSLTIVNETKNLIKTVVLEKQWFLEEKITFNFIEYRLI